MDFWLIPICLIGGLVGALVEYLISLALARRKSTRERLSENDQAVQCRHGVKRWKSCSECTREFEKGTSKYDPWVYEWPVNAKLEANVVGCGAPSCPEHGKCYCRSGSETCGYCCLKADGAKCNYQINNSDSGDVVGRVPWNKYQYSDVLNVFLGNKTHICQDCLRRMQPYQQWPNNRCRHAPKYRRCPTCKHIQSEDVPWLHQHDGEISAWEISP